MKKVILSLVILGVLVSCSNTETAKTETTACDSCVVDSVSNQLDSISLVDSVEEVSSDSVN